MSSFNIEDEIDRLVDKLASDLKARLKKVVVRSEKMVLKQNITAQKSTESAKPRASSSTTSSRRPAPQRRKAKESAHSDTDYSEDD